MAMFYPIEKSSIPICMIKIFASSIGRIRSFLKSGIENFLDFRKIVVPFLGAKRCLELFCAASPDRVKR